VDLGGWAPVATIIAAVIAIIGVLATRVQAKRSADAALISAAASERSSKASERTVEVNERIADQVGQRAIADAFAKRYGDAATQLGHDKAAVRLAGVYAMARLADDWEEQRQQCVDVLCAYLQMSSHHETEPGKESEQQVRSAILRSIGEHLDYQQAANWCDCSFDFSDATLDKITWSKPTFNKRPDFHGTRFTNLVSINSPRFRDGVNFIFATFEHRLQIQSAYVEAGDVSLYGATMQTGVFTTDHLGEHASMNLSKATCRGEFSVVCSPAGDEPQGRIAFLELRVKAGAAFYLDGVDVEGAAASSVNCVICHPGATVHVEATGRARLPETFQEVSGLQAGITIWTNSPPTTG
jgi:hypothetical protein